MNEEQIREATILVIDDQEEGVLLLRHLLRKAGYVHVHATTDSRKAIATYEETTPDLMILDLHMPPPSGFEILEQLAARLPEQNHFPILVLTADEAPITRLKALSVGAKDFLIKPVDHVDLLLRVRNLIETRLLYRALDRATKGRKAGPDRSVSDGGDLLDVLTKVMEFADPALGERGTRVSRVAGSITDALNIPKELAEQIRRATRVFDLGMLGMPVSLRSQTGMLTPGEQDVWRKHTTFLEQVLGKRRGILEVAQQIASGHHERWDGDGYPNRLKGEAIPLPARVAAVALACDNLTRAGLSLAQAAEEVVRQAGFAFDPAVTAALSQAVNSAKTTQEFVLPASA